MSSETNTIIWQSPANIALIKYWGKHGMQLPNNASLSMTLAKALTTTKLTYQTSGEGLQVNYFFEGVRHSVFESKVLHFLEKIINEFPFLYGYKLDFNSSNSFPHSAGIASSASSMSALALCLVSMEIEVTGKQYSKDNFFQRASQIARLGSGSASRSVYGHWVTWGAIQNIGETSNRYAQPLSLPVDEKFQLMGDAVLLVSSSEKKVSSSMGHHLMNVHPFASSRYQQAANNLDALLDSMQVGDFESFASIVECEALTLHSLLMTSSPEGLLLQPASLSIIEAVRQFRADTGTEVCFTIDAGPNIHLLYPISEKKKVVNFIHNELLKFCEEEKWIDDETGKGPKQM